VVASNKGKEMSMSTTTDTALLGRVLWHELLTTDMKGAEKFYANVVGWTMKPFEQSGANAYDILHRPDGEGIGGVMRIPEGMNFPPHWGMYIGVPDLDDAVAHIKRMGGSSLSGLIEVPNVGRMETLKDPQGATFSILEPGSPERRPEAEARLGDGSWHELYTTDPDGALTFYSNIFGWHAFDAMDMGEFGKYQMFGRAFPLGGIMKKPPMLAQAPPHWLMYFLVADVHAAAERVKAEGGKVLNGPTEVPGGDWIVQCMDPQGAAFALHHRKNKE
jgi:predicted enzyme related to lactoylglutathione lyase